MPYRLTHAQLRFKLTLSGRRGRLQLSPRRHTARSQPRLAVWRARQTSLRLSILDAMRAGALLRPSFTSFSRAAENRTRSLPTPWACTTGILRPVWVLLLVGPLGIEPSPYEPESHVLPAYSGPTRGTTRAPTLPNIRANENVSAYLRHSKHLGKPNGAGYTHHHDSSRSIIDHIL